MENKVFIIVVAVMIIGVSCKSNSQKEAQKYMDQVESTMRENSTSGNEGEAVNTKSFTLPPDIKNIVGDWQLVKVFGDDNGDHQADPEEEKDAITTMQDVLILNANGSCEYTVARLEGRYEIITSGNSKKKLVMYDRLGDEINKGRYIISVTSDQLVINRILGGSDFEVFRRL